MGRTLSVISLLPVNEQRFEAQSYSALQVDASKSHLEWQANGFQTAKAPTILGRELINTIKSDPWRSLRRLSERSGGLIMYRRANARGM
jgi:hypothetical protein